MQFNEGDLAEIAHEIVRALKIANGEPDPGAFADAEAWAQESTLDRVQAIRNGASVDPREEHDRWAAEKASKGYIYGPVRNDDPKKGPLTHPLLVRYEDLGLINRLKDSVPNMVIANLSTLR